MEQCSSSDSGVKVNETSLNTSIGFWGDSPASFLGKSHDSSVSGFNGAIDEVLVSCRAYSDDEILQLAYRPSAK